MVFVGTVDAGLGFTIDAKIMMDGSPQYKVRNSKGATYYVTANEAHVYAKNLCCTIKSLAKNDKAFQFVNYNFIPNVACNRSEYCCFVISSLLFFPCFVTVKLSFVKEACPSEVSFTIRGTLLKGESLCSTIIF